jgi:hypothetical protein
MRYVSVMPSAPALALALILLATSAPGQALARPAAAAARMTACETSLAQPGRYLVADGSMKALKGASRMQIRFELQSRTPDRPAWHTLVAPGFGIWNSADPSVRRYVYEKRVQALAAPADYRMVVQFRWLEGSRQVAQRRRVTRVCRQPDLRPDLVPRKLAVKGSGARRYVVGLANSGASNSGPFSVVLVVNGTPLPPAAVPGLESGGTTKIDFPGPRCAPGSNLVARVDAGGRVDERDEGGNELVRPCPA